MSFEELPHTADVRIRARAATLDGIFADLTNALMQVMYGKEPVSSGLKGQLTREIDVSGDDTCSLLRNFLSDVLFVSEVDGFVFAGATVQVLEKEHTLHAVLSGEPFDPARHAGGTEVKGISFSGLRIEQDANGCIAEIVFDV